VISKIREMVRKVVKEQWWSPCHVCNIMLPPHKTAAHTPYCKPAQPKMAAAIFGFGLARAPRQPQGLDRKNTIVGRYRGKAATSLNMGLAQSGHYLVGKYL